MNLTGLIEKNPTRMVGFDSDCEATTEPDEIVFSLELVYQTQKQIQDAVMDTAKRGVTNAKKAIKGMIESQGDANLEVCRRALKSWELTFSGARALKLTADFSKAKPEEPIEFNKQNLEVMLEHSRLSSTILAAFDDYEFWFPDAESAEGNLKNGADGNLDESVVTPASDSASKVTSPPAK